MHVTEKIVDKDGTHILSSTLEADGPFELASPAAQLDAKVIALRRTDSGGVFLQTAVTITEPKAAVPEMPKTDEELVTAYLVSKGLSPENAAAAVAKFGVGRIQVRMADEEKAKHAKLDEDLDALLCRPPKPEPTKPQLQGVSPKSAPVDIKIVEPNRPD